MPELIVKFSLYDFIDPTGFYDGKYAEAGFLFLEKAKGVLLEKLKEEYPGYQWYADLLEEFFFNSCCLTILYSKDGQNWHHLQVKGDTETKKIVIENSGPFDAERLRLAFEQAAEDFEDKNTKE
jgi:hypothetical protein